MTLRITLTTTCAVALLALGLTATGCAADTAAHEGSAADPTPAEQDTADALSTAAAESCMVAYGARGAGGKPYVTRLNGIYFSDLGLFDPTSFDVDGHKHGKTFAQCIAAKGGKPARLRFYTGVAAERAVLENLKHRYPGVKKAVDGGATMAWLDYDTPLQADALVLSVTYNGEGMNAFLGAAALNQIVGSMQATGQYTPDYKAILQQIGVGAGIEHAEAFGWNNIGASGSFALTVSRFGQVFFTPTPGYNFKAPLSLSLSVLWAPAADGASFKSWISGPGSSVCYQLGIPTFCGVKSGPGLEGPSDQWGLTVGATFPPGIGFGVTWGKTIHLGNFDPKTRKYTSFSKPSHLGGT